MGRNVLKYGGKSGILPKVRPIFRKPIRPPTEYEQAKEHSIETGYAEGIPLPKINGKEVSRKQPPKKYVTVEQRINQIKFPELTLKQMNELPEEERDAYKRQYYRAQFLKDAYLQEENRLNRIDELKEKVHQQNLERQARLQQEEKLEHQNKNIEGLPTMQALLDKGMMRRRTKEEIELLKEQRNLNRKLKELQDKENQAQKVLELYHAAANFITTEEQLEEAIHRAFEVDVGVFEGKHTTIEAKLENRLLGYLTAEANEQKITDVVLGEIDGKPGLQQVKELLSGEREKVKRQAQLNLKNN